MNKLNCTEEEKVSIFALISNIAYSIETKNYVECKNNKTNEIACIIHELPFDKDDVKNIIEVYKKNKQLINKSIEYIPAGTAEVIEAPTYEPLELPLNNNREEN